MDVFLLERELTLTCFERGQPQFGRRDLDKSVTCSWSGEMKLT